MSTTLERFSFPLTGSEEDRNFVANQLRHDVMQKLGHLGFLSDNQKEDVALAVGEAGTNAVKHALIDNDKEECVICDIVKADDSFIIEIINPSDDPPTKASSPPEPYNEEGRGRLVIDQIVQDLCKSGLEAECSLDFKPQGDHQRQAIFFFYLSDVR